MNRIEKYGLLVGVIVFLFAIISPFVAFCHIRLNGEFSFRGITLFWDIMVSSDQPLHIRIHDAPLVVIGYLVFVAFRFVFPIQIVRYYRSRTTGMVAFTSGILGEIPSLLIVLGSNPSLYLSQFAGPLPFQILIAIILIWLKPPPTPTDPWDDDSYSYLDAYPADHFPNT